jgi:hypothetical protein
LEAEEILARFFLMAFLNSSCHETPKNEQNNRGRGKKNGEKKAAFFVMSRDGLFRFCFVFLNSPCYETPKKRPKKKSIKNKIKINKKEVSNYFCFSAAANVRRFCHFFFHAPPWGFKNTRTRKASSSGLIKKGSPLRGPSFASFFFYCVFGRFVAMKIQKRV